jgi:hypothetical protein
VTPGQQQQQHPLCWTKGDINSKAGTERGRGVVLQAGGTLSTLQCVSACVMCKFHT